jgi:two-component system chemotaxis response regulator CheB
MSDKKIKILVVEDSMIARELIVYLLGTDPGIEVVGSACDGMDAIAAVERLRPDVVTMDICMPIMDGFEATRRIMDTHPVPIIIASALYNLDDLKQTFRAMEAGAVAAVDKPSGVGAARQLIETVKTVALIKVAKRSARLREENPPPPSLGANRAPIQVLAIGASIGGPPVLHTILAGLTKPYPIPVLIAQQITPGFMRGLAHWLTEVTGMQVKVGENGERALPGIAYLAPDGLHMGITQDLRIVCDASAPENGVRPAVSRLFRSVAEVFGARAAGVLLTGTGRDGALELQQLNEAGALTIAQDEGSSLVNEMPGAAVALGAAMHVLSPLGIAETLSAAVNTGPPER